MEKTLKSKKILETRLSQVLNYIFTASFISIYANNLLPTYNDLPFEYFPLILCNIRNSIIKFVLSTAAFFYV